MEGDVNTDDYTCTTTYYYEYNCTSSGDYDDGTGAGGGDDYDNNDPPEPGSFPSTGGGFTPPIFPEVKNPCEQMDELEDDSSFIDRMNDLKSKTNLSYETGYLISKDGDDISYTEINGVSGGGSISLPNNIGIIDGYMHTHYTGLYPTFSASDIRAIYQLYQNGNIIDLSTFTLVS